MKNKSNIETNKECNVWLEEAMKVFPVLSKKKISVAYKKMTHKRLGVVRAKIEQKMNFNPEDLLLGISTKVQKRRLKPKKFEIFINNDFQKIKKSLLRKEIVQHVMIHELLHIENEDLITISKDYNKRKKKKMHVNKFEEEIFDRYNKLRKLKNMKQIGKKEHLDMAIQKILESVKWR